MNPLFIVFLSFLISSGITFYAVPIVVRMARMLKMFDHPNGRSSASIATPTLGGIAIFLGFVLTVTTGVHSLMDPELIYTLPAIILMLFAGVKDDIINISSLEKIIAQLIAAAILIFLADVHFTNLHGFLGINEMGHLQSVFLTAFIIIVIINSYNLIDGIDGLASGLGIVASALFGIWFYISGHVGYAVFSFSLAGALCSFFYFNVYGAKYKIFMGDTGSLMLGTIFSVIVIKFNEFNIDQTSLFAIESAPAVSFAVLIYPLADTLRVFIIRILLNRSPFSADKNHIHHRLLALGLSHKEATFSIIAVNLVFVMIVVTMQHIGIVWLMTFNIVTSLILFLFLELIIQKRNLIKEGDLHQQILLPEKLKSALNNKKTGHY
jgi:UDP-GlcNAc:undecaprenyl-phosphate/decaprenyl-phosphate GlcNAc-1-phosphate transferase